MVVGAAAEGRERVDDDEARGGASGLPEGGEVVGEADRAALVGLHVLGRLDDANQGGVGAGGGEAWMERLFEVVGAGEPPNEAGDGFGIVAGFVEGGVAVGGEEAAADARGEVAEEEGFADARVAVQQGDGAGGDVAFPEPVDGLGGDAVESGEEEAAAVVVVGVVFGSEEEGFALEARQDFGEATGFLGVAGLSEAEALAFGLEVELVGVVEGAAFGVDAGAAAGEGFDVEAEGARVRSSAFRVRRGGVRR